MQWTDVKVITLKKFEDICQLISGEVCPAGIQIEDYSDLEQEVENIAHIDLIEQDLIDKNREQIIVHHYIAPERDAQDIILTLENMLNDNGVEYSIAVEYVNQDDWQNSWKKYYNPMDIGERLSICPSWLEYQTDRKKMLLDPGMAFGSGTHETTFLCLEVLDGCIKGGENVLDVGTGSGILGIGSILLGAKHADGVDIDPTAVKVAIENTKLNNVENLFDIKIGDLAETATGTYDIIVANIVANAIIALSKDIPKLLTNDGLYITSGIIIERKQDVVDALANCGFKIKNIYEKNNWVCIVSAKGE